MSHRWPRLHNGQVFFWWYVSSLLCTQAMKAGIFRPGETQHGIVALSLRTFDRAIQDVANPLWMIEFHAPWYVRNELHCTTSQVTQVWRL